MHFFDTHAHLYDARLIADIDSILQPADNQVDFIVCPSENLETAFQTILLANRYREVYAACGIHPLMVEHITLEEWNELLNKVKNLPKVVALGETGLDYHEKTVDKELQKKWFISHIEAAIEFNLPLIIHNRKAHGDLLEILKRYKKSLRGIMHGYSGSVELAKELIKLGFYISFSGSITFTNSRRIREVVRQLPLEKILLETDSPFQTPMSRRDEVNTPRNIVYIAEAVAQIKNTSVEQVAKITYQNAQCIYNIIM